MQAAPDCIVCGNGKGEAYRVVDEVAFFRCAGCGSLFADPEFIARVEGGEIVNYRDPYWASEIASARQRSFGEGIMRAAETIRMCRIPIRRFIDIGSGAGTLLDAVAGLLPEICERFYGIELYPPEPSLRSTHANYRIGTLGSMEERFEAGVCIEVIEHMSPTMLRGLAGELAGSAVPGALFLFNSAQPSFVETHDPAYLDPLGRGHIVSYSVAGAACVFEPFGFDVIALPGRDWAFFAQYRGEAPVAPAPGVDQLFSWLWSPVPENMAWLRQARFGPLMIGAGQDSMRCYLEHAKATSRVSERAIWARRLDVLVRRLGQRLSVH